MLRWTETTQCSFVILAEINITNEHSSALFDRMIRSCSGERVKIVDGIVYKV